MPSYYEINCDLSHRIDDLETLILERQDVMCAAEARIFYEDLTSVHEKMIEYETEYKMTFSNYCATDWSVINARKTHLKTTNLKAKLAKILSSCESKSSAEAKTGNQSNPTKQSESVTNSDLQIRKQRFLIKRIESLEMETFKDFCAIKAEVLYNHLSQLYESFILNQIQIEAGIEDDTTLDDQQNITTEIQRKVIDFQTRLRKIMQPIASTSSTESNISIDRSIQPTQTDAKVNLDPLFQKRQSLIKRISSLEPREGLCPEKAKVMYNHLNSLYKSFNSNQTEIESQVGSDILDVQLEISELIQNKVIELQAKFEKIVTPIKLSSSTQSEALQSKQIKFPEIENSLRSIDLKLTDLTHFLESRSSRDKIESNINDIYIHHEDDSEVSKNIENRISYVQTTLNKFVDANEHHEEDALDQLDKMFQINERLEQACTKTKQTLQSEQIKSPEIENSLRSIELKLTNLTDFLKSRSSRDETESTINDIYTHLEDDTELSKDIQNKITSLQTALNKFVDANELREKNALDKLDKILEFNERLEQDYKTKTIPSLSKSETESKLQAMELQLSQLITSCRSLPEMRWDRQETKENMSKISSSLNNYLIISKDIQKKMNNLMIAADKNRTTLNDIPTKVIRSSAVATNRGVRNAGRRYVSAAENTMCVPIPIRGTVS